LVKSFSICKTVTGAAGVVGKVPPVVSFPSEEEEQAKDQLKLNI
jgi:hypothetical protein